MDSPHLPVGFKLKSVAKAVPPLLRSGILSMKPSQVPYFVDTLSRWKFSAASMLRFSAKRYPERLALVDDEGELTFAELLAHSEALARALLVRGVTPTTSFGVVARNGRGIVLPMTVKAMLGAEIMLMNVGSSSSQIEGVLEQNGTSFLFIDDEFVDRVPQREGLTVIVTSITNPGIRNRVPKNYLFMEDLIDEGRGLEVKLEHSPEQGRIIIMSSGTTGIPKGVLRDEPKSPISMGSVADRVPWRKNMVVHQSASMFHAWGWGNVVAALGTGSTLLTMRAFNPAKAVSQCVKYGANGMISAAFFLRQIDSYLDENPEVASDMGTFSFVVSSGNAIPGWLVEKLDDRFGHVIGNFYGSTEGGICSIATGEDLAKRPLTAGKPAIGARVKILDEEGREVPRGEVGLIYTAHELSFTGYLDKRNTFDTVDGLLRIGDLGMLDDEGYLYVCGRADDMVIKGGENIFPREVEELVGSLPGVADVFCHGHNSSDEIVAELDLYVVRAPGAVLSAAEVRESVRSMLAEHSVPDRVYFVDSLPRNAVGKVVPREAVKLSSLYPAE